MIVASLLLWANVRITVLQGIVEWEMQGGAIASVESNVQGWPFVCRQTHGDPGAKPNWFRDALVLNVGVAGMILALAGVFCERVQRKDGREEMGADGAQRSK